MQMMSGDQRAVRLEIYFYSSVTETRMRGIGEMVYRFSLKSQPVVDNVPTPCVTTA
jgi:hypothetical protein